MNSKNYVISVYDAHKNDAGSKAKADIDKFLQKNGVNIIYKDFNLSTDLLGKLRKIKYKYIDIPNMIKNHTMNNIIIQYPIYSSFLYTSLIKNIRKYTQAKVYLIIHDIESLRLFKTNQDYIKDEIKLLNEVDGIVSHNPKMHQWLIEQGISIPIVDLEIFDYINPQPINDSYDNPTSVCFAGNLKKADFLQKISFPINVYGPNPKQSYPDCVKYMGQYTPDELPKYLNTAFGLVWDGTSTTKCDGVFGEYMKYNNPHKVSLYLSSGLPVIIWKEAALADFIINNNLGLAVDSLDALPEILSSLSEKEYLKMKNNVINVATDLRSGKYTLSSLEKLFVS